MDFITNINTSTPEIILLITICVCLLAGLFSKAKSEMITYSITLLGLLITIINACFHYGSYPQIAYHGMYISDNLALLMKIFTSITVMLMIIYSRQYMFDRNASMSDYYLLILFSTLGMFVLISSASMLTIYLGLELLSLPLYTLTAILRTDAKNTEASMKYFIMGAIASGFILYGISLVYGVTGKLNLIDISNVITSGNQAHSALLVFAIVFLVAGIGFKISSVPFHMWAPDIYDGAPLSITTLISSAPKIAAFGMAFRILTLGMQDLAPSWQQILIVMSILSIAIGNIVAVSQLNIRRMLAYSAISHSGYALLGMISLTSQGYSASVFYILVYALMSVAAFGLLVILSTPEKTIHEIDDLAGLNQTHPWLAFLMMLVMLSMAGVPPTVGFFTKLFVLKSLIDVGMTWLAIIGLFFAVIGAYYYLRVIKVMYFDDYNPVLNRQKTSPTLVFIYSINALTLLYFGIFPTYITNLVKTLFISG